MKVIHDEDANWFKKIYDSIRTWFLKGALNIASYLVEKLSNNVIRRLIIFAGNRFFAKDKTYSMPHLGIKLLFGFP
jgi:hypothetical protein